MLTLVALLTISQLPGSQPSHVTLGVDALTQPFCGPLGCRDAPRLEKIDMKARVARLIFIHQRLELLEAMKESQVGPTLMMILGGAIVLGGGVVASVFHLFTFGLVAIAAVPLAALPLIIGIVWAAGNARQNRRVADEQKQLREERAALVNVVQF
jgi:hypothetical protein